MIDFSQYPVAIRRMAGYLVLSSLSGGFMFRVFSLLTCVGLISSCGGLRQIFKSKHGKDRTKKIFVKGDPRDLFAGAKLDTSTLTADELRLSDGLELASVQIYVEKTEWSQPQSQDEILEENSTAEDNNSRSIVSYEVEDCEPGRLCLFPVPRSATYVPKLVFNVDSVTGKLDLDIFALDADDQYLSFDARLIHYSRRPTKDASSFILEANDGDTGRFILIMTLTAREDYDRRLRVPDIDPDFDFISGQGVRSFWPGQITADICEPDAKEADRLVSSIRKWETSPSKIVNNDFLIRRHSKNIPPIGDVNFNCIRTSKHYLEAENDRGGTLGVTSVIQDSTINTLRQAHILIYNKMHERYAPEDFNEEIESTIVHEFGHFIGLGHEFDTIGSTPKHESVMGYFGVREITPWDRKAVAALYSDTSAMEIIDTINTACDEFKTGESLSPFMEYVVIDKKPRSCLSRVSQLVHSKDVDFNQAGFLSYIQLEGIERFPFIESVSFPEQAKVTSFMPLSGLPKLMTVTGWDASSTKEDCPTDSPSKALSRFCEERKIRLEGK